MKKDKKSNFEKEISGFVKTTKSLKEKIKNLAGKTKVSEDVIWRKIRERTCQE